MNNIIKQYPNWWGLLLLIGFMFAYFFPYVSTPNDKMLFVNFAFIGFGGLFMGAILALVPHLISLILKKELKGKQIMIAITACTLFVWLFYAIFMH